MARRTPLTRDELISATAVSCVLLLTACDNRATDNDHDRVRSNPLWGPSVEALDQAEEVEQQVLDAADRQREAIEQQAR
jgi:hypothetical protein